MLVLVCFITTFTSVTLLAKDYSASQAGKTIDSLDVDGNGQVDALTDGLLLLRSMFGLSGDYQKSLKSNYNLRFNNAY